MAPIIDKLLLKHIKLYRKYGLDIKDLNYQWIAYEHFEVIYPDIEYKDNKIQVYRKLGKINCILEMIVEHKLNMKEKLSKTKKQNIRIYPLSTVTLPKNELYILN